MSALFEPPDYAGGSIVNLMQSVVTACGSGHRRYPQLSAFPAERLAEARHVVLVVIDGLGQKMLDRHVASPALQRHRIATLGSVFPSTTATAITTFMTGLAPAQHGLTGWHMHLDEIDQTLAILPLTPRSPPAKRLPQELPPLLFDSPALFQHLERECWALAPHSIASSPFNAWHTRGATTVPYVTLPEMFTHLVGLLKDAPVARYIYAYYPELDTVSHRFGSRSARAEQTLAVFDEAFGKFLGEVEGCDAWVLASADHGFIDSPTERVISLDDHPQFAAWLERPLCGERRAAYCYVAPTNRPAFAAYVEQHLTHAVELRLSSELIRAGWYGPPPFHARLAARAGDYTLLMKDDWTIKDWLLGEKRYPMLGVHGGLSSDEMRVPLIAVRV